MCCKSWKTFLPFLATFLVGILAAAGFQSLKTENKVSEVKDAPISFSGNGGGRKTSCGLDSKKSLQILSKPRAEYTDLARKNQTQGTVTLRVAFQANGKIGDVKIINYLPDGLTEQAIEAAKRIKFEPVKDSERAVTVTKDIQYTFTLY